METLEFYTLQALKNGARETCKTQKWFVLRFNGFAFKVFGKWSQIMQAPNGARQSGIMGHKTQKAFLSEIVDFIESNKL